MYLKQTGIGLVSAIFLIVVVGLLVVAITSMVRTSGDEFAQNVLNYRAFLAAESGSQLGLNRIFAPSGSGVCAGWTFTFETIGLRACQAAVQCRSEVVDSVPYYTVQSDGRCDLGGYVAQRRVLVRAKP
ncbi:MAG: hypothetical protein R3E82_18335 [Pseudomonadales bacterium]